MLIGGPAQVSEDSVQAGYTALQFHPDGLILGAGAKDSTVRIWEVRDRKVTNFHAPTVADKS